MGVQARVVSDFQLWKDWRSLAANLDAEFVEEPDPSLKEEH